MARRSDATQDDGGVMLPMLPKYPKGALCPNPQSAKAERGDLAYAQGPDFLGDFGDEGAAVRPALGLPPTTMPKPKGEPSDTAIGWR